MKKSPGERDGSSGERARYGERARNAALRLIAGSALLLALAGGSEAATIVVNSNAQAPGAAGDCTLGEAIEAANTDAAVDACTAGGGADTITLPAGDYVLTAIDNDTDGPNGLPSVSSDITIVGADATTTIVERDPLLGFNPPRFRVFRVAASGTLTLEELTIAGGFLHDDGDNGPGIFNAGGALHITSSIVSDNTGIEFSLGGGIFNDTGGTLTVANSSIADNTSNGDGGAAGIYNRGTAEITETAIDHNLSFTGSVGGIRNSGTMTITNSTVSRNFMDVSIAAGIRNQDGGTLTISNSTIADNEATFQFGGTGGIVNSSGTVSLRNTILAANTSFAGGVTDFSNCSGVITSLGNNLVGESKVSDACVFAALPSDITGVDTGVLDTFADETAPGNAHFPLLANSPAIDAGADCEATDQLGVPRPVDGDLDGVGACDIGAIELVPPTGDVNSELTGVPDPATFSTSGAPVPEGPAGTFSFSAEFCNVGTKQLTALKSVTTTLSAGNALTNRDDGSPAGVGSERTFPTTGDYSDGVLSPGECVDVLYVIGLAAKAPFAFNVDVVGAGN